MDLTKEFNADRRLVILRILAEDPEYTINDSMLQKGLRLFGHSVTSDWTRTHLRWLEEQGLIRIQELARPSGATSPLLLAILTERGLDAAIGRARVDGVARPRPRS